MASNSSVTPKLRKAKSQHSILNTPASTSKTMTTPTPKSTRKKRSKRDRDSTVDSELSSSVAFLLPFNELPSGHLDDPLPPTTNGTKAMTTYTKCFLGRTSDEQLENGSEGCEKVTKYELNANNFVLLRPETNERRPGVARIISFHIETIKNKYVVKIQWFYRGEDLTLLSHDLAGGMGEDEVFESQHFDLIDIDTIAGRCFVYNYPQWLAHSSKSSSHQNNMDIDDGDNEHEQDTDVQNVELDSADDDDKATFFRDNYSESSVFLYCTRFYDPHTQQFLTSTFENPNADPLDQLDFHTNKKKTNKKTINNDPDFIINSTNAKLPDESDVESMLDDAQLLEAEESLNDTMNEAEVDDYDYDENQEKSKKRTRRRKQPGTKTPTTVKRQRRAVKSNIQFALPSELGEELPCRDKQKDHIRNFLLNIIQSKDDDNYESISRCLYISGVPGTGKTATVREVTRELRNQRKKGELPPFTILELNAMTMGDGNNIYVELYSTIIGNNDRSTKTVSSSHAAQLLEKRFTQCEYQNHKDFSKNMNLKEEQGNTVIVLDEMDILLNKKQKVLYDLVEWPSRKFSNLAIIGIANTMDLPERMLPRIGSRLGLNRLTYPPYTRDEIITILKKTPPIKNYNIRDDALRLCASKVGGVSGDIRRAIELCKRSNELVNTNNKNENQITATHMQKAIHETSSQFRLLILKQLSLLEKLVIISIIKIIRMVGMNSMMNNQMNSCTIEKICESTFDIIIREESAGNWKSMKPKFEDIEEACWRLSQSRMIVIEKAIVRRLCRVILNLPVDDCIYSLKDCEMCNRVLSSIN